MGNLSNQIEENLPAKIILPIEIKKLLDWIEKQGYVEELDGDYIGYLGSRCDYDDIGGTDISFYAEKHTAQWWVFSSEEEAKSVNVHDRLSIFARTGADGSAAAFWLADDNTQKIVHIGSGSGSALMCVLANEPIDFLRLIAIGYEEICWSQDFAYPPNHNKSHAYVPPHKDYQEWVKNEFNTTIPTTAQEIIKEPAEMWDVNSNDPFCRWLSIFNA